MKQPKIALLGGGSLYFEYVIAEIACTPELAGARIVLYDINERRVELMRRVGLQIVKKTGAALRIERTLDLGRVLDGASVVIASIGVGGPGYRFHKRDCDTVARHGIIHTTGDTVGPAGLAQGLRIIPIFVKIGNEMRKRCPGTVLLNHSNPMMPICRAVTKYCGAPVIGYCHNLAIDVLYFAKVLGLSHEDLDATVAGVNHCGWLLGLRHGEKDVYPALRRRLRKQAGTQGHQFAREVLETLGLFPIGGDRHLIEFFPHARRATSAKRIPYGLEWRSTAVARNRLQREINKAPREMVLKAAGKRAVWLPTPSEKTPESMGEQIKAILYGPPKPHYVNTINNGAITNLPDWAIVEIKGLVGAGGARSIFVGELPPQAARWTLAQIHAHELLVDAAVEQSRAKAIMAFACDPMIRDFHEARVVLDALVRVQSDTLKAFRK